MSILLSSGNYFGTEQQFNEDISFKLNITQYLPDVDIPEHYHENAYLSLLINGAYEETNRKEETIVTPGEIVFRPAGYNHTNHFSKAGGKCLNIELKKDLLQKYDLDKLIPKGAAVYKAGVFEYLYRVLYSFTNDVAADLSEEYILNWLAAHSENKIPVRLVWLPKVKTILETEFDVHHTIQSIADRVFVHPIYLARAFKEREGLTIGEYQLKARVKKAMELLFNSGMSVAQIGYTTGFTDAAHLIRSFRLYYQISPGKFRQSLKS